MYKAPGDPSRLVGAARFVTSQRLGGPTREVESTPLVQGPGVTTIATNNPDRVGLVIVNSSTFDVWVGFSPINVGINSGIMIPGSGGAISVNVNDDFTLPAREWLAVMATGFAVIYVLQVISDVVLAPELTP